MPVIKCFRDLGRRNVSSQMPCSHESSDSWMSAPFQYPIRHLIVRSREVSKPQDWLFKLSHRFDIWQAPRQQSYRGACQISERSDNSKYKSHGFETLRDLTIRRLIGYWNGAQSTLALTSDPSQGGKVKTPDYSGSFAMISVPVSCHRMQIILSNPKHQVLPQQMSWSLNTNCSK